MSNRQKFLVRGEDLLPLRISFTTFSEPDLQSAMSAFGTINIAPSFDVILLLSLASP